MLTEREVSSTWRLQCLNRTLKKDEDNLSSRASSGRTRGAGFRLKGRRLDIKKEIRYKEDFFCTKGNETLAQALQRGGRCPIPGQARKGSE